MVDPGTVQWREMFGQQMQSELSNQRGLLEDIKRMLAEERSERRQEMAAINGRVRQNEVLIASLRTWVPVVGGAATIGSVVATAIVQILMR